MMLDGIRPRPRASGRNAFPLSHAQQRMWFLHKLAPASPAYNVWLCLDVVGELDVEALRAALAALTARHEILRTTYREAGGVPVQEVHTAAVVSVDSRRVARDGAADARQRALAAATELAARPFDLRALPLLRAHVVGYDHHRALLLLVMHHIAIDEWSTGVFAADLRRFYAAARRGEAPDTAPPALQYADYAAWERTVGVAGPDLAYWTDRLAGLEPLQLGLDSLPAEPRMPSAGALPFVLPDDLAASLEGVARSVGLSKFMALLAVLQATLSRWCGQTDIAVGVPFAGREDEAWAETLGFFANTLVMRTVVAHGSTFRDLLAAVRDTVLEAFQHRSVPFDALVERLRPQRGPGRQPLLQVLLAYTEGAHDSAAWSLDGVRSLELVELPLHNTQADLTLAVDWSRQGVRCTFRYVRGRFATQTIGYLAEAFVSMARACAHHPGSRPGSHPVCTPQSERRVLSLTGGEAPAERPGAELSMPDLFRETVRRAPRGRAIEAPDAALTFAELDERSERLARALRRRGVGPERLVAVCLPRQASLVVTMLAVWKAGGAFLLLDSAHPADRLLSLLRDADAQVLVAGSDLPPGLERGARELLRYDAAEAWEEAAAGTAPAPRSRNLAYAIYTSGSTGRPKAVLIEHGSLVGHALTRLAPLYARAGGARPLRVAASASVTFDVFVDQFLTMVALGQCLVLLGDDERLDPGALLERVAAGPGAGGVDALHLVPSQLELLVDSGLLRQARRPGLIRFGGEVASRALWDSLRAAGETSACHTYGLTECSIWSTWAFADREPAPTAGRGAGDARVRVVDADFHLLPPGAVGEICVGGVGVGRGYFGQPSATAARFVPDPFGGVPGARLYRTGDQGRLGPDGHVQFLGRLDGQLKIRGHRIEPAEVEAALRAGADLREVAVVGTEQAGHAGQLVAFAVPGGAGTPAREIRSSIRADLPSYLVPDQIVCVPELPRTTSGKVDRRALTRLASRARRAEAHVAPRTDLERQLCSIWAELLAVDHVGLTDDFFMLGGHSLLAVRLAFLIRERLGIQVPVPLVMRHSTVEALARELRGTGPGRGRPRGHLVELRAGAASGRAAVFVHPLGGTALCYRQLVDHLADGPALYGLELLPGMDGHYRTLQELAAGYAGEILARLGARPVMLVGWSAGGVIAYEVARQLLAAGSSVALAALDTHPPTSPGPRTDLELLCGQLSRLRDDLSAVGAEAVRSSLAQQLLGGLGIRPHDLAAVDRAHMEALVDCWERLVRVLAGHRMSAATLSTRVVLAAENPASSVDQAIASWKRLVGTPTIDLVAGDHRSILHPPAAAQTARSLEQALREIPDRAFRVDDFPD